MRLKSTSYTRTILISLACASIYPIAAAGDDEPNTGEVQRSGLIGTWKSQNASHSANFQLQPDGTFAAKNLPTIISQGTDAHGSFSDAGHWSIGGEGPATEVDLHGKSDFHATLYREAPPYKITFQIGDPDDGQSIDFHRDGDPIEAPKQPLRYLRAFLILGAVGFAFLATGSLIGNLASEITTRNAPGCFGEVAGGGCLLPIIFLSTLLLMAGPAQNLGSPFMVILLVPTGWLIALVSRAFGK